MFQVPKNQNPIGTRGTIPPGSGNESLHRNQGRSFTAPKGHGISRKNLFRPGRATKSEVELVPLKVERHTWHCSECGCKGETITTQMTEVADFHQYVFRDHDLASPTCQGKFVRLWATGSEQWAWTLGRHYVQHPYESVQLEAEKIT